MLGVLGDFSKGPGPADGAVEDGTSSDSGGGSEAGDASAVGDSTAPVEASPGIDSGHEEASTTDSGSPHDAGGDGSDGGCGAGSEVCSGTCVSLSDPAHCGSCGHDCNTLPNVTGVTACKAGVCSVPPASCAAGYGHCTANPDDGCETAITTPSNCGACGAVCGANTPLCNGSGGSYSCGTNCSGMTPTYCAAGMVCTNLQSDANNCMSCGTVCPGTANGTATCTSGNCGLTCAVGFHLCGSACLSDSSVSSCGGSCTACSGVTNGTAGCNGTSCTIASCNSGYANCDGVVADGCNVDTQTDPANCNGCNKACAVANAAPACVNGTCEVGSCNANYLDCDHSPTNGCEVDELTDNANCGACGRVCAGGETCANGNCACGGGTTLCGSTCVNTQTDNGNCGGCGQVCTNTACAAGLCNPVLLASNGGLTASSNVVNDGTFVYWTNYASAGSVAKVIGATGAGLASLSTNQSFPQDIAVYSGTVFFTLENAGNGAKLMSVSTGGGGTSQLDLATNWAALGSGSNYANGIASDGAGHIYWASYGGGSYLILKWTVSTAVDSIVANSPNGYLGGLAADSTGIVYSQPTLGRVIVPPNNAYDTGDVSPGAVTAAGGYFYYVIRGNGSGTGAIHRYADSATMFSYPVQNLTSPSNIASDGTNIYWSDSSDGAIYRVPVAGGTPFTLAKQSGVAALTVDATYVYFINASTGQLLRVPK